MFITIILSLISGLLGVLVGSYLSKREEKRKEKLQLLKVLIINRYNPLELERTKAINLIPVVFCGCGSVCKAHAEFMTAHNHVIDSFNNPAQLPRTISNLDTAYVKMIEVISKELGFGKELTWDKLRTIYIPQKWIGENGNTVWY